MKNSETVMLRFGKHAHDELFDVANALERNTSSFFNLLKLNCFQYRIYTS